MPTYQHCKHNFHWAMDRLRENKRVRRACWIVENTVTEFPKTQTRTWHLFMVREFLEPECAEYWTGGRINGWGGSVGGGSEIDKNGMLYSPTDDDRAATDWEMYELS
jgi:hypothetical protein